VTHTDDDTIVTRAIVDDEAPEPESEPAPVPSDEPETEAEPAPVPDSAADEDVPRRRSKRGETEPEAPPRRGRRLLGAVLVLAVVGALLVPHVRLVLRQSFTQMPQTFTALAFTGDPTIRGTVLSVPLTVQGTNTGTDTYEVKVWTVDAAGKVDASTTAKVPTVKGVTAAVVTLPIAADATAVWVSLDGTDHTIYYKIA
jgi:hypothetical protein